MLRRIRAWWYRRQTDKAMAGLRAKAAQREYRDTVLDGKKTHRCRRR